MGLIVCYLIKEYLRVFLLSISSFIGILFVSRLEEIAHFAAIGASFLYLLLFSFYQILYVLPIAIPISSLISVMILFQKLSQTHELTALRTVGLSFRQITTPILGLGMILSCINFYIASELTTSAHLKSRQMVSHLTTENPLLLLQSAKIAKLQGAYVQMEPVSTGKNIKNLLIALKDHTNKRISLLLAKKMTIEGDELKGEEVTVISNLSNPDFDQLIIENKKLTTCFSLDFSRFLQNQGWKISNDHLKFNLLRARIQNLYKTGREQIAKCYSEMIRRISLGIAVFTFNLMGISFGITLDKNQNKKNILLVFILGGLTLVLFLAGKELSHLLWMATICFFLPHLFITIASILALFRLSRGLR
ncbi:MAG: LptF/LptG family permease [Chlamydiales bacterium]